MKISGALTAHPAAAAFFGVEMVVAWHPCNDLAVLGDAQTLTIGFVCFHGLSLTCLPRSQREALRYRGCFSLKNRSSAVAPLCPIKGGNARLFSPQLFGVAICRCCGSAASRAVALRDTPKSCASKSLWGRG